MEARYPNTPPSPSDIYAAYKDLPQVPGGMQALQNIVNQHKNDGLPNGSIALSILNAANQAQVPPPMPQGTVADQVVAQAAPPIDPNMLGLAAPGLEQYAQEQQMATGGLVALARGGEVPGYAMGGEMDQEEMSPWDLSSSVAANPTADYYSGIPSVAGNAAYPTVVVDTEDGGIPAVRPAVDERTTGGTSAKVPELSADAQIDALAKFYEGDHAKAAELKGQLEKRLASKENKDLITDIATGLGMMFSGQGTKTQAMGQGLMAFASQRGRSGEAQDRLQGTIDAMVLQDEAQRNAAKHAAAQTVFGARTKAEQQKQAFLYDAYLHRLDNEAKIKAAIAKSYGGYDHFSRKQSDIDQARVEAWKLTQAHKDFPTMSKAQADAVFKSYLPPDLRDMDIGPPAAAPTQPSYNLPAGYGYTPG